MDEKTEMRKFVEEIAETLSDYLYENCSGAGVNGENVYLIAPFIEVNEKIKAIAKKYGIDDKD